MYQRILIPYDGSNASDRGLDEAIRIAKGVGASLRIIHVVNEITNVGGIHASPMAAGQVIDSMRETGEAILQQGLSRALARGVAAETRLVENFSARLSDLIEEDARRWQADLIVIGTHGRRGVSRALLGSDAEQILRSVSVPVLLVRSH